MRREGVLSADIGLVGFLRGLLTNLGTPPITSEIRSILVRPRFVKDEAPDGSRAPSLFILRRPGQVGSFRFSLGDSGRGRCHGGRPASSTPPACRKAFGPWPR